MSKKNFAKKHGRMVLAGQLWIDTHSIERRVMGVAEGYAMVRAKGCAPFTVPISAMDAEWTPSVVVKAAEKIRSSLGKGDRQ